MNSEKLMELVKLSLVWIRQQSAEFFSHFENLPRLDLALQILILTVVFILVITVIIAVGVLLLRIKNNWNARRFKRLEESWEGQVMEVLSSDESVEMPLLRLKRRDRDFFVQYLYRFASRLRGRELEMIKALAKPHLDMIANKLDRGYPELRARNVNILATLGFPEYIEPIIESLRDGAPIVKMAAARILAHPDYPQHIDLILPELASFDEWSMNFLASMLAEMGAEAAPRLREAFQDSQGSLRVRIAAAEALRRIGDLRAADLAEEVLKTETDPELNVACLKILKQLGTPRHRSQLLELTHSHEQIIRLHALAAMGAIGSEEDIPVLQNALGDPSRWVVLQAARALAQIKSLDFLKTLAESGQINSSVAQQVLAEAHR